MDENDSSQSVSPVGRSLSADELSALVSGAPFLDGLAPAVVAEVAAACELVEIQGDRQLLRREVPNDSMYVVVHGGLRTVVREGGHELVVAESYRGDSVGILGLLPGIAAPVEVFAIRDSILLRLTRARFASLSARIPDLAMRLAGGIARRAVALLGHQPQWTTWKRPGATTQNIAFLVPNRDREFASTAVTLARAAFSRYGRIGWISRETVDRAIGPGSSVVAPTSVDEERVLAFLQNAETGNEIVFYEADTTVPLWSERCLRQADRILAVLRADQTSHFEEVRAMLERTLPRKQAPRIDVALLHAESAEVPRRSITGWAWLLRKTSIHHLRMGSSRDYERLARTLVHSGIAVVFSGGGARGIAHLGVLKALEDAQLPVDAIAGTSMGSIFAAGYARGWRADEAMARVRELFRRRMAIYDPTLPLEALFAGRKLERVLQRYFEGLEVETLWLPFFCVSTDLSRAEPFVHDRGELWRAVVASCSIPGIFPPRREGDRYLVDGGVMNNLPIDIMAARFGGAIIACDVSQESQAAVPELTQPDGARPDGRWAGLRRLFHRRHAPRGPGILETLMRTTTVGSRQSILHSLARGQASLYLQLPVERFGMLDWGAHDEIYAAGYEAATRQLARWVPPWVPRAERPAS